MSENMTKPIQLSNLSLLAPQPIKFISFALLTEVNVKSIILQIQFLS